MTWSDRFTFNKFRYASGPFMFSNFALGKGNLGVIANSQFFHQLYLFLMALWPPCTLVLSSLNYTLVHYCCDVSRNFYRLELLLKCDDNNRHFDIDSPILDLNRTCINLAIETYFPVLFSTSMLWAKFQGRFNMASEFFFHIIDSAWVGCYRMILLENALN